MTNRIGAIYIKNETKLSGPIKLGTIYDENQTRQRHDQSYRCDLSQK